MQKRNFGVIGLAVMGANIALNVEDKGFPIAVYNRTAAKTEKFMAEAEGRDIKAAYSVEEFVQTLERPRNILLMIKSGQPVDSAIAQLKPLLEEGDTIIDGGNSLYEDTERRAKDLESMGLGFMGMGVSGGEEGARNGPSLMPGGTKSGYENLEPILTKIAAQVDDGACVTYIGPGGAGHYVKMVHNGIEYGDMQLIAEAYDLMKNALNLSTDELERVFTQWNQTEELNSFLIEITADIFSNIDPITDEPLIDSILDAAGQKGTGRWTVVSSLELGVPIPTIYAAVNARVMSAYKVERVAASKEINVPTDNLALDKQKFIDKIKDALYCSKMCSYAQGMALMNKASDEYDFDLNLSEIARIWQGGCIIRAGFLGEIMQAYNNNPDLANLLLAPEFKQSILDRQTAWREVLSIANQLGIAVPAFSSSLDYFDSYRRANLPQNLTQAQRDYFGAHTYERIDRPRGEFVHTKWVKAVQKSLQMAGSR